MKEFYEVDSIFIPNDTQKLYIGIIYNIFEQMVEDILEQLKNRTYEHGMLMVNYAPVETFIPLMAPYMLKFYYDENSKTLYLVLVYGNKKSDSEMEVVPIVHINVTVGKKGAFDYDSAAYLFALTFIQHTGQMGLSRFENADSQK